MQWNTKNAISLKVRRIYIYWDVHPRTTLSYFNKQSLKVVLAVPNILELWTSKVCEEKPHLTVSKYKVHTHYQLKRNFAQT